MTSTTVTSSYDWCNNIIGSTLNQKYKHDFTLIDIDGASWCNYTSASKSYDRLILYESKWGNEKLKDRQEMLLHLLSDNLNWDKLDYQSGVYLLRVRSPKQECLPEDTQIDVYRFVPNYQHVAFKRWITMSELYNWFSCKDV